MDSVSNLERSTPTLGHNSQRQRIVISVKLFNRVYQAFGNGIMVRSLEVPEGVTVGEILAELGIPESAVFIAFVNGRDVTDTQGKVSLDHELDEGDALAISGPVPYSWGYGAPVV